MTTPHILTPSPSPTAPLALGRVVLTVRNLDLVADYYQTAIGLHLLHRDGAVARLGAGDTVLLELRRDAAARPRSPREAGLFHTAFLLPGRADLARWTQHAITRDIAVAGASDHDVSEALYLTDPEGNGIEIYADRPRAAWVWQGGLVTMGSGPLDVPGLLAAGGGAWQGLPPGAIVGHVHLQVGAIPTAEAFYAGVLGLGVTSRYPGGTFYAADGYHHHIATNVWNSRGAGMRQFPATGLTEVEIILDAARAASIRARAGVAGDAALADPWGTPVALTVTGGA